MELCPRPAGKRIVLPRFRSTYLGIELGKRKRDEVLWYWAQGRILWSLPCINGSLLPIIVHWTVVMYFQMCASTLPIPWPFPQTPPRLQSGFALCSSYAPSIFCHFTPLIRASIISYCLACIMLSWIQYHAMTSSKTSASDPAGEHTVLPWPHCCMILARIEKGPDKEYLGVVPHILKLLS